MHRVFKELKTTQHFVNKSHRNEITFFSFSWKKVESLGAILDFNYIFSSTIFFVSF